MDLLDIEVAQLDFDERLRKAEQRWRPLVLVVDEASQAPAEAANGLLDMVRQRFVRQRFVRQRLHVRAARDEAPTHTHRPRVV